MARRPKRQREEQRVEIARMWAAYVPVSKIAEHFGLHRSNVWREIKEIRQQWQDENKAFVDAYVVDQMMRLDDVERKARVAYAKSCGPMKKRERSKGKTKDGPYERRRLTIEEQCGDPRFLDQIIRCIELRLKLIGAFAPERFVDMTPADFVDVEIKTHGEWLDYQTLRERVKASKN